MAFVKMIDKPEYSDPSILRNLIFYILRSDKAVQGLIGGFNLLTLGAEPIIEQMETVKKIWHKTKGNQVRHFVVSFDYSEFISEIEAWRLGHYIAAYYADRYQIVYAVHEDAIYIHIHFVFNTVSFKDGLMYAEGKEDYTLLKEHILYELNIGTWRDRDKTPRKFSLNNYIFR